MIATIGVIKGIEQVARLYPGQWSSTFRSSGLFDWLYCTNRIIPI